MWLDIRRAHTESCASPQHYKSTHDTLLCNFDFFPYTQILHCLNDLLWAFGPALWASGRIMHASVGADDLYFTTFLATMGEKVVFWHFLDPLTIKAILEHFLTEKRKKCIKSNSFVTFISTGMVASAFFIFSQEKIQNDKKLQKRRNKGTKEACTVLFAVHALARLN